MPEANLFVEKRAYPRTSVKLPVTYRLIEETKGAGKSKNLERKQGEQKSHSLDLNLGGLYLVTEQFLDPESILRMEISLPKLSQVISVYARVVWSDETGGGLQFESMVEKDEIALKRYLSQVPEVNMNR